MYSLIRNSGKIRMKILVRQEHRMFIFLREPNGLTFGREKY